MGSQRIPIAVALLALACAQGTKAGLPAEPASISGQITSVNRAGEKIGSVRVEAQPKDSSGSAKAVARIGQETTILRVGGGAGDFNSLAEGQWVRVWFSGPVAQSYPVQATAAVVMIDSIPR